MTRVAFAVGILLCLNACGIKRPLIHPRDIPAYEEKQRKKYERLEADEKRADDATRDEAPR